jgi:hypothetical protein
VGRGGETQEVFAEGSHDMGQASEVSIGGWMKDSYSWLFIHMIEIPDGFD